MNADTMTGKGYPMKRLSVLWTNDKVRSECRIMGNSDPYINHITFSAQTCSENSLYIALTGKHVDGHSFIEEAILRGTRAIVLEHSIAAYHPEVLYIIHPHPRRLASLFSRALAGPLPEQIIGVTGTDGKSTTCEFLWYLYTASDQKCGLLTTVSLDDGKGKVVSPYRQSTPEAPELYQFLSRCRKQNCNTVVLETTSHGLSSEGARLIDISFSGAILTPITREHLEFHGTVERYVDAKMNLVRQVQENGWVVIPHDFVYLDEVYAAKKSSVTVYTYAWSDQTTHAALTARTVCATLFSRTIEVAFNRQVKHITLPYGQSCYAENALGALLGSFVSLPSSLSLWSKETGVLPSIAGRFEEIKTSFPFMIIVDFAHTEQAFKFLFSHIREHLPHARIIALFGAAGERDRSKREPMGNVAAAWCHAVFLTDEDPRGESPEQILDDLERGIVSTPLPPEIFRIHNRKEAIRQALAYCKQGDVLLLLAKSHERTIQYRNRSIAWNESETVLQLAHEWEKEHA